MIDQAKAMATPENLAQVDAAIHRFQALQTAVTVKASKGEKVHTWLSRAEVVQLMDAAAGGDFQAQRDRLALGLLLGAGLRRNEAIELTFSDVKLQPIKGKLRAVLQIRGKGAKDRPIPVSDKLAAMIDGWSAAAGGQGFVLRSVNKGGEIGDCLSAVGLFKVVRKYGRAIGKPTLAPHDLRRTYAQIGYENGIPITQISKLLGHSSITTTQRYLNLDLNLETTISDFVPL
jgi:integrase